MLLQQLRSDSRNLLDVPRTRTFFPSAALRTVRHILGTHYLTTSPAICNVTARPSKNKLNLKFFSTVTVIHRLSCDPAPCDSSIVPTDTWHIKKMLIIIIIIITILKSVY